MPWIFLLCIIPNANWKIHTLKTRMLLLSIRFCTSLGSSEDCNVDPYSSKCFNCHSEVVGDWFWRWKWFPKCQDTNTSDVVRLRDIMTNSSMNKRFCLIFHKLTIGIIANESTDVESLFGTKDWKQKAVQTDTIILPFHSVISLNFYNSNSKNHFDS